MSALLWKGVKSVTKAIAPSMPSQPSKETITREPCDVTYIGCCLAPRDAPDPPWILLSTHRLSLGCPQEWGSPTAFLLMTFQSSFLNVSHGVLSPLWIIASPEGFLASQQRGSWLCQQPSGKTRAEAGELVSCTHCKAHSCGLLLRR